eukprot:TRINITY_DN6238_c1_g1_i1.p1 TRINITY_DN6238_c1_g1~~TRINITY_DN6238_c1_g1_i1.p1  ORF type:complete len:647 (-),score=118.45 TRINITY_DN6238_c1_g1_i1:15-1955(-)
MATGVAASGEVTAVWVLKPCVNAGRQVAGALARRRRRWLRAGCPIPSIVHKVLRNRTPLLWSDRKPKPRRCTQFEQPAQVAAILDEHVKQQEEEGAVERSEDVLVTSPIFVIPKATPGKYRVIIDLRYVNLYQERKRFRQEGLETVAQTVRKGDWLTSLDFTSGYNHAVIRPSDRKYLGFQHRGSTYRYRVLPFGSSSSPWIFHKLVRPMVQLLRERGLRIVAYVDDFLIMARTKEESVRDTALALDLLGQHGWHVSLEKSEMEPKQRLDFLGLTLDTTEEPRFHVPPRKRRAVVREAHRILKAGEGQVSRRRLARLVGMCISLARAIGCARVLTRRLTNVINRAKEWYEPVKLNAEARADLEEWLELLDGWEGTPVVTAPTSLLVTTDAADEGWGGVLGTKQAFAGVWTQEEERRHITWKELSAIRRTLEAAGDQIRGQSILVRADNVAAVAYVNKLTGKSAAMAEEARALWRLVTEQEAQIRAVYLPGAQNTEADYLSRLSERHEWEVDEAAFEALDKRWGPHTCDRFATAQNTKCPRYNSRQGVDAFTVSWLGDNNWVVPPTVLLGRVARLLRVHPCRATVIAPNWPAQFWHMELRGMAEDCELLSSRVKDVDVKMEEMSWQLIAFRLTPTSIQRAERAGGTG